MSFFSAGSKGGLSHTPPSLVQNFLNFMQFFRNFGKIIGWRSQNGLYKLLFLYITYLRGSFKNTSKTNENISNVFEVLKLYCETFLHRNNKEGVTA